MKISEITNKVLELKDGDLFEVELGDIKEGGQVDFTTFKQQVFKEFLSDLKEFVETTVTTSVEQATKKAVKKAIPEDYSQLINDVEEVKTSFTNLTTAINEVQKALSSKLTILEDDITVTVSTDNSIESDFKSINEAISHLSKFSMVFTNSKKKAIIKLLGKDGIFYCREQLFFYDIDLSFMEIVCQDCEIHLTNQAFIKNIYNLDGCNKYFNMSIHPFIYGYNSKLPRLNNFTFSCDKPDHKIYTIICLVNSEIIIDYFISTEQTKNYSINNFYLVRSKIIFNNIRAYGNKVALYSLNSCIQGYGDSPEIELYRTLSEKTDSVFHTAALLASNTYFVTSLDIENTNGMDLRINIINPPEKTYKAAYLSNCTGNFGSLFLNSNKLDLQLNETVYLKSCSIDIYQYTGTLCVAGGSNILVNSKPQYQISKIVNETGEDLELDNLTEAGIVFYQHI